MELHDQTAAAHELVAVIVLDGLKARHAFAGKNGQIRVELLCAGTFVQCRVLDNGAAPANVQRGSGLKIVGELIKALDGRFEQKFGTAGSTSILTFPYSIVRRWTVSCSAPAWGALALLWQIFAGAGFPNHSFCDSWVVGFLEGPTMVSRTSDWRGELGRWLKPFLDR